MEDLLYIFVSGAMLMLSVLGLESAIVAPSLERWSKRFFVTFFSVLVLNSSTFLLDLFVLTHPNLTTLLEVSYFIGSWLSVTPFPMLAFYLLHCCGEDWRGSLLFRIMLVLWAFYCAILVSSQFTTTFYYVTADNVLHLGPAYLLSVAPILAMLLLLVTGVVRRWHKLTQQYRSAFLVCLVPVTLAVLVHTCEPSYSLVGIGLTISALSMYRIIESSSIEQALRQQREIANQRASIAVLQMRPHFIYNTMTSIYYLCDQDPELAKQVTMDFITYLRKNFSAIASEDTIPFSEELEHTRAYLAVEQAQYEDVLLVDYDTPHTQFRMPPLTLQPIVENAVKHGMDPDSGPLHIWIRTRATNTGSEITVVDDGPGFDPSVVNEPHTTLANIRQRLEMMCNGVLDIASRKGCGAEIRVTIPQQR